MPFASLNLAATPVSLIANSFPGLLLLSFFYGLWGIVLTALQFLRLGPKRFFKRTERPAPPSDALDPIYGTHSMLKLKSSGISIHYVSKGLPNQPMILFLHGFPECWYSWRHQMKHFSREYRVVAIDQRGYGLSSKLPFVSDYRLDLLAGDVADVIEQLGYESCILVGHDWGGLIAWTTTILYPHLVEKLIILNAPHPAVFRQDLSLKQIRRSWYMFFYQFPSVPELLLQSDDFSSIDRAFRRKPMGLINANALTDADLEVFKYTFAQAGTAKAAINYYRAFLQHPLDFARSEISTPVLLLWGCQDMALGEELADLTSQYCGDIRVKKIGHASHWLNQDVPEMVNKYIDVFLKETPAIEHRYEF